MVKMGSAVTQPEMLVPIRLEIDHDHYKLRDTFTWNLNGAFTFSYDTSSQANNNSQIDLTITPDIFAQGLCDDF